MKHTQSILICGVGGQGIILASDVLSKALFLSGHDVKKNEIHGMSQREGSVVSFIRFGEKVNSPMVSLGEADYLLGFEQLEASRNLPYLKKEGVAVVNEYKILPTPVQMGLMEYPEGIEKNFAKVTSHTFFIDAMEAAKQVGNARAGNIILLGVLSRSLTDIHSEVWMQALSEHVKPQYLDLNKAAFELGRKI